VLNKRFTQFVTLSLLAAPLWFLGCGSSTSDNSGTGGASGGKTGSGGATSTGGTTGTGGSTSGGGASGSAGKSGTGGATSTGGASGGGGKSGNGGGGATATGGASSLGGSTGAGGSAGSGGKGGNCSFAGGDVTSALYPTGLTLTKACSPYIVADINVKDGGVLTIEAGVTVEFEVNTTITVGLTGTGKILANGTAQSEILLTSQEMDINGEGWYGLEFSAGTVTGSQVTYTQIRYAGGNFDAAIVGETGLAKNSVTLDHVAISMNVNNCALGIMSTDATSGFITKSCTLDGQPTP
jgi:hypothetical protein